MPTSRSNKPTVLITIGDPAGIGPEVTLKALASTRVSGLANFFVIGDWLVIDRLKADLGLRLDHPLLDLSNVSKAFSYGISDPALGKASIEYIDEALRILKEGSADALVTAPVNKFSINSFFLQAPSSKLQAPFKGHTEYIAGAVKAKDVAMMFVGENFKVTLVTRHIALKDVAKSISINSIYKTILLTHASLKKLFRIQNPKIGVCGLNPHAGEKGLVGKEERDVIIPAVRKASADIRGVTGPFPPDVIFYEALNKRYDAVIAMYHDQGLIPFKMLYFKNGVNMTLGLPFIRTSPDHGTAFDIAGRGVADPASMIEAISLACRLSKSK